MGEQNVILSTCQLCDILFVCSQATENAEKRWKEWQQQEEDNRTDILNQLQGELLSESQEQGISVLGLPRLSPNSYKGLADEQLQHIINCQQQQIDEKRVHLHCLPSAEMFLLQYVALSIF